jgi:phage tail sheath protein FI
MPEYLSPGVYVEEVSFRSKTLEGVTTSTTGFAGMTRTGPVHYADGPLSTEPRLVSSFSEFERTYGGLEPLMVGDTAAAVDERLSYLAHAARAFFANGGQRLFVSRVFVPHDDSAGLASRAVALPGGGTATWRARWPGTFGNVWIETKLLRSHNIAYVVNDPTSPLNGAVQVRRAQPGAIVEIVVPPAAVPVGDDPSTLVQANLYQLDRDPIDGRQIFRQGGGTFTPPTNAVIQLIEMRVVVKVDADRSDVYDELGADPEQKRYIGKILQAEDPEDEDAVVYLEWDPQTAGNDAAARLVIALTQNANKRLQGGTDGKLVQPDDLEGDPANPDDATKKATGLEALGEIDEIAIVALPDGGAYDDITLCEQAADRLITHAELLRYRIAVVDPQIGNSLNEVRKFRGRFDSKYAALYYPWVEILDPLERPTQGAPPRKLLLPPSGFVTGIYARSDVERGVHKAPANEVVRGLTKFELNINKGRQDILNPDGINALRFFEGRGNRVWGARTMTSDPEWKYVNVRRLFIYLEHTIDKGTQWAVFEPNNPRLWANVKQTIEDFLLVLWKDGALLGKTPAEAYFVTCDRTTMTQNDLDNGRMIALIGVAPVKPAEFVIFRIGQWTANAST